MDRHARRARHVLRPRPRPPAALAEGLTVGNASLVDRRSSWWAHRCVLSLARGLRFDQALVDIKDAQSEWEKRGAGALGKWSGCFSDSDASVSDDRRLLRRRFDDDDGGVHADAAGRVVAPRGRAHGEVRGRVRVPERRRGRSGASRGYPDWWLKAAGFADGPPPPPDPPRNGRGPGPSAARGDARGGENAKQAEAGRGRVRGFGLSGFVNRSYVVYVVYVTTFYYTIRSVLAKGLLLTSRSRKSRGW